jgi:hypothetical protein
MINTLWFEWEPGVSINEAVHRCPGSHMTQEIRECQQPNALSPAIELLLGLGRKKAVSHFPSLLPPKVRELPERHEMRVSANGGRINIDCLQSW